MMQIIISKVSISHVTESVYEAVAEAMELAEYRTHLQQGKPTILKVNLGWDLFIPGSVTSPWVIEGVIRTIRNWVGEISIVESDQVLENIEKAFSKLQLIDLCKKYDVKWINMTDTESVVLPVPNGKVFDHLRVARILTEAQMITIPVMKTHAKTTITGAIKNQWGCISKMRHNYHLVLDDALADINSVITPSFAVMDATVALEGNGPKSGNPVVVDRVLASGDFVALDAVQAKMMGFNPQEIPHIVECGRRGLGVSDPLYIITPGEESIPNLKFKRPQHNLVSRVEEFLRRSKLKKLVFDTPLFTLMLRGAKLWYLIWYYVGPGEQAWNKILKHPLYGKQWLPIKNKKKAG